MDERRESEPTTMNNRTTVERKSERELVITRAFNGPARIVFEAWTKPELLKRWWAPKSTGVPLLSCEADVRVGGRYRFEFGGFEICIDGLSLWLMRMVREIGCGTSVQAVWE